MRVVAASKDDACEVAKLHAQSITTGFLSTLPKNFLAVLYMSISRCKWSTVFVAINEQGKICGFIAGAISVKKMYRQVLLQSAIPLIWYLLPCLFSMKTVRKVAETVKYGIKDEDKDEDKDEGELLSIAVCSAERGGGVGRRLAGELEEYFSGQGIKKYKVVTYSGDVNSNAFYVKCGFKLRGQFLHHGNLMNKYVRNVKCLQTED